MAPNMKLQACRTVATENFEFKEKRRKCFPPDIFYFVRHATSH